MLGNKRAETFPCRIIYCLSHLGQGVSFHPTLAAPLLLPESLGLERRQLSFSWRSQVQAPGFGKRPPWSPWGWHSILCCWLGTLTPVQRGAPTKNTGGGSDFRMCLFNSNLVSECFRQLPPSTICFYVIKLYSYKTFGGKSWWVMLILSNISRDSQHCRFILYVTLKTSLVKLWFYEADSEKLPLNHSISSDRAFFFPFQRSHWAKI